jgi:hypothetical protein
VPRVAPFAAASAIAACLALPTGAGAQAATETQVAGGCAQTLVQNAPGFVLNTVESGQLPRIMGPIC